MKRCVPLEPAAEEGCQANSKPPLIFELPPAEGRWGTIPVWLVDPGVSCQPANVIFYIHGAGWVF